MAGQIYLPQVNWLLFAGVVFVVGLFKTSSNLAAAYGVAVTADMIITSVMGFFVLWRVWGWSVWTTSLVIVPLLLIEQAFFTANILKVLEGGWLPLLMAVILFIVMWTWVRGYRILSQKIRREDTDLGWLARKLETKPPIRVPGTAVFLSADTDLAPTCLMHNLKHNRVLHERNIILSIKTEAIPRVVRHERLEIDRSDPLFTKVIAHYGFMETPNVPKIFETCRRKDLNVSIEHVFLPLPPVSAPCIQFGDAALAATPIPGARAICGRCNHLFPHTDGPRRRSRNPGGGVIAPIGTIW